MDENKRTEIKDIGHFILIERLMKDIAFADENILSGLNDNAVCVKNTDEVTLTSTSIFEENIHFDLTYVPLKHLGYKIAAGSFSKIAAMNAKPQQIIISIAVSNRFSVEALEEIAAGAKIACAKYKVNLSKINIVSAVSGMLIYTTTTGQLPEQEIVYKHKAQDNDLICVSGDLGAAYAGLLILEREKQEYLANPNMQPDLMGSDYVLQRQLKPEPRIDIIDILKNNGVTPSSMTDIVNGLAYELIDICKDSDKGCYIYENKIPIDMAACQTVSDFNIQPVIAALNGGQDYELLFTIKQSDYEKIKDIKEISVIGHISDKASGNMMIPENGTMIPLQAQGI